MPPRVLYTSSSIDRGTAMPPPQRYALAGMVCSFSHCTAPATVVMVEQAWNRHLTFESGAGVVCDRHAVETRHDGCLSMSARPGWGGRFIGVTGGKLTR